jgi:hypothetical protein
MVRGDVDPIAHQVAVGLFDDVAQMNADPEFYAALGRQAGIALDEAILHLDRAAHGVHHAAEFDEAAVPSALDHATVMHGDGGINEVAAQRPESRHAISVAWFFFVYPSSGCAERPMPRKSGTMTV